MKNTELVVLRTFPNVIAAEMAKTTLDSAEIDSFLRSDDSGHLDPALSLTNGVKLLVRAEDAEAAAEMLEEMPPVEEEGGDNTPPSS